MSLSAQATASRQPYLHLDVKSKSYKMRIYSLAD
jgi:hypothetical protein